MKNTQIIVLITAGLLLAGCGKDDGEQSQKAATPAAAPAPAAQATAQGSDGGTRYIDHTKDEMEFRLKKSLAGLESLLEDITDAGQVEMMKKDIAALRSELAKL